MFRGKRWLVIVKSEDRLGYRYVGPKDETDATALTVASLADWGCEKKKNPPKTPTYAPSVEDLLQ